MRSKLRRILFVFMAGIFFLPLSAQEDTADVQQLTAAELSLQIDQLKNEVLQLRTQQRNQESKLTDQAGKYSSIGIVLFLFGAFCALWAQDSGRNPWVWFFLGCIFQVFTVFVLLVKNWEDIKKGL